MKKVLIITVIIVLGTLKLFAQGGNTCADALAAPITLGTTYTGQTTCGQGNDYAVASSCMAKTYYDGMDKFYYFCATQDGCVTVSMPGTSTGTAGKQVFPSLSIFNGCPTSGGTCFSADSVSISANATANGPSTKFMVTAGTCYYIVVDTRYIPGGAYADCINYSLTSTFILSPPAQTPGGNTCATALANPLTLGLSYPGQTTCCAGNDYKGSGSLYLPYLYDKGSDWFYYFCATQNGWITVEMLNATSGCPVNAKPTMSIFRGCPTSGGVCIGRSETKLPVTFTPSSGPPVTAFVETGKCYYIVVDANVFGSIGCDCVDYTLKTTFSAPPIQPSCTNMGFENGLTGWTCTYGKIIHGQVGDVTPHYDVVAISQRSPTTHTIVSSGTDGCGGFPRVAPGGGASSLKMGDMSTQATGEQIVQTFTVTAGNANFTYKYALVLGNPDHATHQQPFFKAILRDQNGDTIPCSEYIVTGGNPNEGFVESTACLDNVYNKPYVYKTWTTVNVDLAGYIGHNITVEFTIGDCSYTEHFGYVYLDCSCAATSIPDKDTICLGQPTTLHAPSGYKSYLWQPGGQTTQNITVTPTTVGNVVYTLTLTGWNGCNRIDTIIVVVEPAATASFTFTPPDCGQPVAFTSASTTGNNWTFTGGTPATSTAQTPSVSWGTAGTYNVTLSLGSGECSIPVTKPVTIPTCPMNVIANGGAVCVGKCIDITAVGSSGKAPYTYAWNPGGMTGSPVNVCPTTPTTYTVTTTDANGSTASATAIVTINPSPTIATSSTPVLCNGGSNGTATANPAGNSPFTYLWSNTQTDATATNLSAGTYTVTVTDKNGCTSITPVIVTEPAVFLVTATNTDASCGVGNDGTATATASGGTSTYTYLWSNTQTTATITNLPVGTYTVTATDANGCTNTDSVTVVIGILQTDAGSNVSICSGKSTTLTATNGGTYAWSNGGTTNPIIVSPTTTTTYTVLVTTNGCTATDNVVVTVNDNPQPATTVVNATCDDNNGSITVTPPPPATYIWDNGQTTQIMSGIGAGTHFVTVTDANGCTGTATANVTSTPGIVLTMNDSDEVCSRANGSANVIATGGTNPGNYTYQWSNNNTSTTNSILNLSAGTYSVTVSDGVCTATDIATIGNIHGAIADFTPIPYVASIENPVFIFNDNSTGTVVSWNWNLGDGATGAGTQLIHTYSEVGAYLVTLIITDNKGCVDSAQKIVVVKDFFTIYIPNAFSPNGDGKNDVFGPKGTNIDPNNFTMYIFDRWGKMIYKTIDLGKPWNGTVYNKKGVEDVVMGVYSYIIYVTEINGPAHEYVGRITLLP